MLKNGLGELLLKEVKDCSRFFDLFTGSGSVAAYIATKIKVKVWAFDLQKFSVILTEAIIARNSKFEWRDVWAEWEYKSNLILSNVKFPQYLNFSPKNVFSARNWCEKQKNYPITHSYGGYYFSPQQALAIDAFRKNIPQKKPYNTVCLASLICAASECAAAPGHTAQPFQPTETSTKYIEESWNRNLIERIQKTLIRISQIKSFIVGRAAVEDANQAVKRLRESDLAFIDPPYSGVQYSRFYHVLETIAHGDSVEVTGAGRYPAIEYRPTSSYSLKSTSKIALNDLLKTISKKGSKAIITFPDHACTNGLSGETIRNISKKYFKIRESHIISRLSSLGGKDLSENGRAARKETKELILLLTPK